jgi:predicted HAD superfamily Cof-like phosphohydrolase
MLSDLDSHLLNHLDTGILRLQTERDIIAVIDLLLYGNLNLTNINNHVIFDIVHQFIISTGRF